MWIFGLFCLIAVHVLARFGSRVLMWLWGWLCLIFNTLAHQLWFPIADVALRFALFG